MCPHAQLAITEDGEGQGQRLHMASEKHESGTQHRAYSAFNEGDEPISRNQTQTKRGRTPRPLEPRRPQVLPRTAGSPSLPRWKVETYTAETDAKRNLSRLEIRSRRRRHFALAHQVGTPAGLSQWLLLGCCHQKDGGWDALRVCELWAGKLACACELVPPRKKRNIEGSAGAVLL